MVLSKVQKLEHACQQKQISTPKVFTNLPMKFRSIPFLSTLYTGLIIICTSYTNQIPNTCIFVPRRQTKGFCGICFSSTWTSTRFLFSPEDTSKERDSTP